MFSAWQEEKATAALVGDAQAMADRLAGAKRHIVDSHAAAAWFWQARYLADGQPLWDMQDWAPADLRRFITAAQTRIAALRKARAYDSSDGLAVWLHTARALTEPRIAPPVREVWGHLLSCGPNADGMAADLMAEAGLPVAVSRRAPTGFGAATD